MLAGVALAFLVSAASPPDVPPPTPEQIKGKVATLGIDSTWGDLDDLERQFGCTALPVLVEELHSVNPREITYATKDRDAEHIVWVIAALRYITGMEFTGRASANDLKHHSERAKYFLTLSTPPGEAKIVSLWPSRGTLYLGPIKTQESVIKKWRVFSRSGQCRPSDWAGRRLGTFFLGGWRD